MTRTTLVTRLALASLVACIASGCDRNSEQHSHTEVTELQAELEQLANQVGRLEFRIYELENHQPSDDAAATADDPNPGSAAESPARQEPENGRYDLTPVDP